MQIFRKLVWFPSHRFLSSLLSGTKFCNCLLADLDTAKLLYFHRKDRNVKISVKCNLLVSSTNQLHVSIMMHSNVVKTFSFDVMGRVMSKSHFTMKQENCIKLNCLWQFNRRNASKSHKLYVITNRNRLILLLRRWHNDGTIDFCSKEETKNHLPTSR